MQKNIAHPFMIVVIFVSFVLALPVTGFAEKTFGGITFVGEREDVCVLIEGECVQESIYFKLDTCDKNKNMQRNKFTHLSIPPFQIFKQLSISFP